MFGVSKFNNIYYNPYQIEAAVENQPKNELEEENVNPNLAIQNAVEEAESGSEDDCDTEEGFFKEHNLIDKYMLEKCNQLEELHKLEGTQMSMEEKYDICFEYAKKKAQKEMFRWGWELDVSGRWKFKSPPLPPVQYPLGL